MAAPQKTLLDEFRTHTKVDLDSLDAEVAATLGPFVDHTSNQAIALAELLKQKNRPLLQASITQAKSLQATYPTVPLATLAVEIATINLSSLILPFITGRAHIQTNPLNSYSTTATVDDAHRILSLYTHLHSLPKERICIKIPSTWEGLQACRILSSEGVATLATTLFCMPQAALAGEVGCEYIAPYINGLKVHFEPGYVDGNKGFVLAEAARGYLKRVGRGTMVLPASLTSVAEVWKCRRAQHVTVAPGLLGEMAAMPAERRSGEDFGTEEREIEKLVKVDWASVVKDEAGYRLAVTLDKDGESEKKLTDAIVIFCRMQGDLEELVKGYL